MVPVKQEISLKKTLLRDHEEGSPHQTMRSPPSRGCTDKTSFSFTLPASSTHFSHLASFFASKQMQLMVYFNKNRRCYRNNLRNAYSNSLKNIVSPSPCSCVCASLSLSIFDKHQQGGFQRCYDNDYLFKLAH